MNAASVRPTCQGTILGSCVDAPEFEVVTSYVNEDNTGEADSAMACAAHLADTVREVWRWYPGFETVEVREVAS